MQTCDDWLAVAVLILRITLDVIDMVKARRGNDGPSDQSPFDHPA